MMLQTYALHFLRENPNMPAMVGIGLEPLGTVGGSEDLLYGEQFEWTKRKLKVWRKTKTRSTLRDRTGSSGAVRKATSGLIYPGAPPDPVMPSTMNRKQRRAAKARARKKK